MNLSVATNRARPIGSEFAWRSWTAGPALTWPTPHQFYRRGRDAVIALWLRFPAMMSRLWVPDYFCPHVTRSWIDAGIAVVSYRDDPLRSAPDWQSLSPQVEDAVLAVNYFGMRNNEVWKKWRRNQPRVLFIEDHTHDPLGAAASDSGADFVFASLRKTLPVPDGAVLWSPRGRSFPPVGKPAVDDGPEHYGSALKLAGMMLKSEYLEHHNSRYLFETYRRLETEGEYHLETTGGRISPWSRALLSKGYPLSLRQRREENVRGFIERFRAADRRLSCDLLFDRWPEGCCPLNPVLLFDSAGERDDCRRRLIESHIYPPIHWTIEQSSSPEVVSLSQRIMTVPVDFRCNSTDLDRLIEELVR